MPYLRQCGPPAFSATLPPILQAIWLEDRRVIQTERRCRLRDVKIHDPRLHDRDSVLDIDREDLVHPLHLDDDPALSGHGAAAESGSRPRGRNGMEYSLATLMTSETCFAFWRRPPLPAVFEQGESVAFIDEQFGFVGNDTFLAHDLLQLTDGFGVHYFRLDSSSTCLICCFTIFSSGSSG